MSGGDSDGMIYVHCRYVYPKEKPKEALWEKVITISEKGHQNFMKMKSLKFRKPTACT